MQGGRGAAAAGGRPAGRAAAPPPPASASEAAIPLHAAQPLLRAGAHLFAPLELTALRPGDVGFMLNTGRSTLRQRIISGAQGALARSSHMLYGGDARVYHAFVVVGVDLAGGRLHVVDATAGKDDACIAWVSMGMGNDGNYVHVNPRAHHLFCRFADGAIGRRMAALAGAASCQLGNTFSMRHCVEAPFCRKTQTAAGQRALLAAARQAPGTAPFDMMCGEFVSTLACLAAMGLWAEERHVPRGSADCLRALRRGRVGNVFANRDLRRMMPAALEARLAADAAVVRLGYLPSLSSRLPAAGGWPLQPAPRRRPGPPFLHGLLLGASRVAAGRGGAAVTVQVALPRPASRPGGQ